MLPSGSSNPERNFRLVVLQLGISTFASSIFVISIVWISIAATGSAVITGITSSLMVAPLIIGFVIGAFVDRVVRKRLLVIMISIGRGIASLLLLPAAVLGNSLPAILFLFASAIIYGLTMAMIAPARMILSRNFLRQNVFIKGMSFMNVVSYSSRIMGYAASAILMTWKLDIGIILMSAIFFLSAIPVVFLPAMNGELSHREGFSASLRKGFRLVKNSAMVSQIIFIFVASGFFLGMSDTVLTVTVRKTLNLDAMFLSTIFIATSLGGIAGSILISRLKGAAGKRLVIGYLVSGFSLLVAGLFMKIVIVVPMMFLVGISSGLASPTITTLLFSSVDKENIGRIQGLMDTFGFSFKSMSAALAGFIIFLLTPFYVFLCMSAGLIILAMSISRLRTVNAAILT